jgi:hypothetical protein
MSADREYTVYRITRKATGESYIGVTCMRLRERWSKHTSEARLGLDRRLYRAMRAYGLDAFEMVPIRTGVPPAERWTAEREEIARAGTVERGYNELPGVPRSLDDPGVPACFGPDRPPVPAERRQRLHDLFVGRKDSAETRARKCAAQRARADAGGNDFLKGRERGAAFRTRLSLARGGVGTVRYDGNDYPSIPLAAAAVGVTPKTFAGWVRRLGTDVPKMIRARGRRPARVA